MFLPLYKNKGNDGEQAIALAGDLVPDVLLLDLLMPKLDGISAIHTIKRLTPTTQITILTSYIYALQHQIVPLSDVLEDENT